MDLLGKTVKNICGYVADKVIVIHYSNVTLFYLPLPFYYFFCSVTKKSPFCSVVFSKTLDLHLQNGSMGHLVMCLNSEKYCI